MSRPLDVSSYLIGTCQSLCDVATEEECDSKEFCKELDEICFRCDACDWWYASDKEVFVRTCTGCAEEGHGL